MNLGEIRARVKEILGNRDDLDSAINTYVNLALLRAYGLRDWRDLATLTTETLVADTYSYNSPTGKILSMVLDDEANSRKLIQVSLRVFDAKVPNRSVFGTGRPTCYIPRGNTYDLFRTPDDAYSLNIWYIKKPATLSADADEPDISDIDNYLINYAVHMAFGAIGQFQQASFFYRVARDNLKIAIQRDKYRPDFEAPSKQLVWSAGEYWLDPFVQDTY